MNSKVRDKRVEAAVGTAVGTARALAFEPVHDSCVYVSGDQRFVPLRFWQAHRTQLAAEQRRAAYVRLLEARGLRSSGPLGVG